VNKEYRLWHGAIFYKEVVIKFLKKGSFLRAGECVSEPENMRAFVNV
jgi:hypothetical protein